ncbi:MAG: DUF4442 domain-containing protein [Betaproteobacteria bacterium]|nr:DUF4442 domain-containing protein [Betaproteobacteria bacterium]
MSSPRQGTCASSSRRDPRAAVARAGMNLWPPFLGAGIKVTRLSADYREIDVRLDLRLLNRNYVGTQFGGSLYAMTDPFFMLMMLHNLGPDYVVWDKAGAVRYVKPGRGAVHARFRLRPGGRPARAAPPRTAASTSRRSTSTSSTAEAGSSRSSRRRCTSGACPKAGARRLRARRGPQGAGNP